MASSSSLHASPAALDGRRRLGQFAVGVFAGACAIFAPRLTLMVGQSDPTAVTVVALPTAFIIGGTLLSLIVGGVALILEWDGTRSPKDTFMAALGVPALLSGVFSTANVSSEAVRYAELTRALADQRAKDEGIQVDDAPSGPTSRLSPATGHWPPELHLQATAYAAEQAPTTMRVAEQKPSGVAIQYQQVRYWVVLAEAPAKESAQQRAAALGTRYGALSVQPLGAGFAVTLSSTAFPYADAVTRAIDLKKKSQGAVTPRLVRAG